MLNFEWHQIHADPRQGERTEGHSRELAAEILTEKFIAVGLRVDQKYKMPFNYRSPEDYPEPAETIPQR